MIFTTVYWLLGIICCICLLHYWVALDRLSLSRKLRIDVRSAFLSFQLTLGLVTLVAPHTAWVGPVSHGVLTINVGIKKVFNSVWKVLMMLIIGLILVKVYLLRSLSQNHFIHLELIVVITIHFIGGCLICIASAWHWVPLAVPVWDCAWSRFGQWVWSRWLSSLVCWFPHCRLLGAILLSGIHHNSLEPFGVLIRS